MHSSLESSTPSDIRLLLRADAEQCWLHREVIPVLQEVETSNALAKEEVGAALAYLEAMWDEAAARARETDAAHDHLRLQESRRDESLSGIAGRYHAAVRVLRRIVAERVTPFLEIAAERGEDPAKAGQSKAGQCGVRVTDKRPDGCPRAA